jgi:hypothetical protein
VGIIDELLCSFKKNRPARKLLHLYASERQALFFFVEVLHGFAPFLNILQR